jgi:hypothetical protein
MKLMKDHSDTEKGGNNEFCRLCNRSTDPDLQLYKQQNETETAETLLMCSVIDPSALQLRSVSAHPKPIEQHQPPSISLPHSDLIPSKISGITNTICRSIFRRFLCTKYQMVKVSNQMRSRPEMRTTWLPPTRSFQSTRSASVKDLGLYSEDSQRNIYQ